MALTRNLAVVFSAGWNELLIASFSHRSIAVKDGILLATGLHVHRNSAHSAGVGAIFDRWENGESGKSQLCPCALCPLVEDLLCASCERVVSLLLGVQSQQHKIAAQITAHCKAMLLPRGPDASQC